MAVPKIKNTFTSTETSAIGREIHMRGIQMNFIWAMRSVARYADSELNEKVRLRLTLVSTTDTGIFTTPTGVNLLPPSWLEPSTSSVYPTTMETFNTQKVRVLKQRTYVMQNRDWSSNSVRIKFWCPIKGKRTQREEESTIVNDQFGLFVGRNYYLLLEIFNTASRPVEDNTSLKYAGRVYFKDA